jgi:hypothetical protein
MRIRREEVNKRQPFDSGPIRDYDIQEGPKTLKAMTRALRHVNRIIDHLIQVFGN